MEIYPSLISSDLLNLQNTINILDPVVDGFHIDVMDDHFVPNLTWGPAFINAIAGASKKPLHVHLMVDNPAKWPSRLNLRSKDLLIFHYEAIDKKDIPALIEEIKNQGVKVGIAINPKTAISEIFEFLPNLDNVLIMSVQPGFSGQKFMLEVTEKILPLVEFRNKNNLKFKISMDGGIDKTNIKNLSDMGVEQFGVASAIFSQENWARAVKELKK